MILSDTMVVINKTLQQKKTDHTKTIMFYFQTLNQDIRNFMRSICEFAIGTRVYLFVESS